MLKKKTLKVLKNVKRIERNAEKQIKKALSPNKKVEKKEYTHPWTLQNLGNPQAVDEILHEHCCGCESCLNTCPHSAISMEPDKEGFLYPVVDQKKCDKCGICVAKCPSYNVKPQNLLANKCYAVWNADLDVRLESSSGGVFSLFAEKVLSEGGVVFGAAYDENFVVRHTYIESAKELGKLRKSKYVQSSTGNSYKDAKAFLRAGRTVLYTGCPCQIAGLYSFLGKKYENLLTLDFICHGVPSPGLFNRYLEENYSLKDIKEIDFRDKKVFNWSTHMNIYMKSGEEIHETCSNDSYFKMFLPCLAQRPTCSICKYTALPRVADLTMGDWWGVKEYSSKCDDGNGTSILLVNNEKGEKELSKVRSRISLFQEFDLDLAKPRNYTIDRPFKAHQNRKRFFSLLDSYSFNKSVYYALNNKFDIGIYGLWYGENYGSILTYYGLNSVLEDLGLTTMFIYNPLGNPRRVKESYEPISFARRNGYYVSQHRPLSRLNEYNNFCDSFILGSDQLWNPGLSKKYGHSYYLNFVDDSKKRIAYGTSMGRPDLLKDEPYTRKARYELLKFDAVSVRDDFTKEKLENDFEIECSKVLDPVLLCREEMYCSLAKKGQGVKSINGTELDFKKEYIFAYILDPGETTVASLHEIANRCNKPIYVVLDLGYRARERNSSYFKNSETNDVYVLDFPTTENWLYAILESSSVITDSFHGTLFSYILEKPFVSIPNNKRGKERFSDVLEIVNLENRVVTSLDDELERVVEFVNSPIDFRESKKLLESHKKQSIDFLTEAIYATKETDSFKVYESIQRSAN